MGLAPPPPQAGSASQSSSPPDCHAKYHRVRLGDGGPEVKPPAYKEAGPWEGACHRLNHDLCQCGLAMLAPAAASSTPAPLPSLPHELWLLILEFVGRGTTNLMLSLPPAGSWTRPLVPARPGVTPTHPSNPYAPPKRDSYRMVNRKTALSYTDPPHTSERVCAVAGNTKERLACRLQCVQDDYRSGATPSEPRYCTQTPTPTAARRTRTTLLYR